MSVSAPPSPPRTTRPRRPAPALPLAVPVIAAAAAGAAWAVAPEPARGWTAAVALVAWVCVATAVVTGHLLVRRARRTAAEQAAETSALRARMAHENAGCLHLVNVVLPDIARRLRDGAGADEAVAGATPVAGSHLHQAARGFAAQLAEAVRHAAAADARHQRAQHELHLLGTGLDQLGGTLLPTAVGRLREGTSADHVLAELEWPESPPLRALGERFVRELAHSERRTAAAQAASAKSLSRVQAKAVSMLADLREMQDRHGEDVLGDLLRLDHATSQLGLITDRLALLMGGRSSRAWNRPIVMESILRGAVGRIAAYQRVRMHCSTTAAISGYAAEGVMHLLAELMDNAANFSPPIDEVHVYVEERTAGIVVTIEDSGLKMADAAMRHAEEAVSGRDTDLALLQGTRLGLAVVGRLAAKYRIGVSYRPSSRGGTGVVVLLPPQLLAQQREPVPHTRRATRPTPAPATPGPAPAAENPAPARRIPEARHALRTEPAERPVRPAAAATRNGLPVRAPGRTMAQAERERHDQHLSRTDGPAAQEPAAPRDAGTSFGAFHRGRRTGAAGPTTGGAADTDPPAPA